MCAKLLYDMDRCVTLSTPPQPGELKDVRIRDSPCVQDIGNVITKTHRCVAFPNIYQH